MLLWIKCLLEAISILLGVLIAPLYNLGLPCHAFRLGVSSRNTISGVTAANYKLGHKRCMYWFITYLFWFDPDHMESSLARFKL